MFVINTASHVHREYPKILSMTATIIGDQSSSQMETDIILEGFQVAEKTHDAIYSKQLTSVARCEIKNAVN